MSRSGGYPSRPETRVAAVSDVTASIEHLLVQAERHVARMDLTPTTQLLRATVESHRRVVDSWRERPPADDRVQIVRERIEQVLRIAKATAPTVRNRRLG